MADNLVKEVRSYGGWWSIIAAIIAACIAYGSATATTANTLSNHEGRIIKLEHDNEETGKTIARIDQKVTDIWERIVVTSPSKQ